LKKVFFIFILAAILPSCSTSLFLKNRYFPKKVNLSLIKESYQFLKIEYIKGFGPIISYKIKYPFRPSSIGSKILVFKLNEYESIIDKHIDYKNIYDTKKSNQPSIFSRLTFQTKDIETIQQKNIDIELIKSLTRNYEKWGPEWEESTQAYAENISIEEIRSIRSEIRRIYGKL
jgi:hypothetical protein